MSRTQVFAAISFVVSIAASIYATQMLGVVAHEIVGHGLGAEAVGGTFASFAVDPSAHGWARYDGVPEALAWIPLWGGIAIELVVGLLAMALWRARRYAVDHVGLACLGLAVTNAGSAIGYALEGAVAGAGDARGLHDDLHGVAWLAVVLALFAAYFTLLDWTMRRLMPFLDAQAGAPPSHARRRAWFLVTAALPIAVLLLARPRSPVFEPWMDWLSRVVILAIVVLAGLYRVRTVPLSVPSERPPLGLAGAAAWAALAVALAVLAARFWAHGVTVA